jgi:hypothetical protein
MTDEEKIALIKLMIGDVPASPFYPLFSDTDYGKWLAMYNGDIDKTVRTAAISASMFMATVESREVIGDLVLENEIANNYIKALNLLIANPTKSLPDGLMPWTANDGSDPIKLLDYPECKDTKPRTFCGC